MSAPDSKPQPSNATPQEEVRDDDRILWREGGDHSGISCWWNFTVTTRAFGGGEERRIRPAKAVWAESGQRQVVTIHRNAFAVRYLFRFI